MDKDKIIEELNKHICGYSYINVISYACLNEFVSYNETGFPDSKIVLTYDEWMLVIGLWLKNINKNPPQEIETIEVVEKEAILLYDLLEKLHYSYLYRFPFIDFSNVESLKEVTHKAMDSPVMVQEAIFYGGEGAYDLQYTSFIAEKYKKDREWILKNKGIDVNKLQTFYITLKQLLIKKDKEYRDDIIKNDGYSEFDITYTFVLDIDDIVAIDSDYRRIINLFSFDINKHREITINGIEDFNPLVECPLIKLNERHLFIPKCTIVASALYELPFFWIVKDNEYFNKYGADNRGDAAETITKNLLERIFPKESVIRNVNIIQKKDICAEIDVLVKYSDVALVFQVKSKRLSLNSRKGDKESIAKDFEQAIGKAYEQALTSEIKMMEPNSVLKNEEGEIPITGIKKTIKIGVTLDFFPAVEAILKRGLGDSIPFISMSIFDLDMLTRYLTTEQFVDYIVFRVQHRKELFASNEAGYLGFYLKHNGFEVVKNSLKKSGQEGYNWVAISEDYACEIDKIMNHDLLNQYLPEIYEDI
jgi:hypothetical protein